MRATVLDLWGKYCFLLYFSLCVWGKQMVSSSVVLCEFFQELLPEDQSCHYSHKTTFDNPFCVVVVVKAYVPCLNGSPSQLVLPAYKTPQRWYFYVLAGLHWRCYDDQIAWEMGTSSKQSKRSGFRLVYHRNIFYSASPQSVISGPRLAW